MALKVVGSNPIIHPIKIRPILSDGSYFYPVMRDSKDSMQQSGGLLLVPGWTGTTPYIVPCGHNGNESHYPPRRSKINFLLK